jgi:prepilin-type N-terminal cleavage/methylation domain-containing protein
VAVLRSRSRRGARARVEALRDDAGFTLVEVVVAATILVFVVASAAYGLTQNVHLTGVAVDRTAAANLATQELEQLRNENANGRALDGGPYAVTVRGIEYTVTPSLSPSATAACPAGTTRRVTVTVAPTRAPSRSTRYDSVLTC